MVLVTKLGCFLLWIHTTASGFVPNVSSRSTSIGSSRSNNNVSVDNSSGIRNNNIRSPPLLVSSTATTVSHLASTAEFEMQELRAQLDEMRRANVPSSGLDPTKRLEIESYVRSVAKSCPSPVPLRELGAGDTIVGTWRLAFSTEQATLDVLPKEARIFVKIYGEEEGPNGRRTLDYVLKFTKKVFALNDLKAKSFYTVDTSPMNPGLVSFTYDEITTDIFGLTIPTGLFGLLKGRVNYIESVYFDRTYWISRGFQEDGTEYFNVYFKEEDDDDDDDAWR